ncbi:MAG: fatty acid desaturase, partial [Rhodobacteraceae bacterium]|nr:fatty acid desaturase [Paracoccaceae bacterium]
ETRLVWAATTATFLPYVFALANKHFGLNLISLLAQQVVIVLIPPLALIFLNNNFHVVHHSHPNLPWYALPAKFRAAREQYLARNEGYYYRSYAEIFRYYFWRAKDPVPHPLFHRD